MRVLIADDHSIVRSGLTHLVAELDGAASVAAAVNFPQLLALVEEDGPVDLVTLDLRMPGMGSLDDIEALVRRVAPAPVVVFSAVEAPDEMRAVLARGVRAFVPKSTDDVLVLNILRLVLAGGVYMPPELGMPALAAGPVPGRAAAGPFDGLTRRQADVLELMAQGLSNQEIGDRLRLNLSTVKTHVTGVLKALGVGSRTQAVLMVRDARHGNGSGALPGGGEPG